VNVYHFRMLSEALTPITHAAGAAGNESILFRRDVLVNGVKVAVPGLSGNSLRHVCLRETGSDDLIQATGLSGKLSKPLLYFLKSGGSGGSSTSVDLALQAEIRERIPFVSAVGGQVVGGQTLQGRVCVGDGWLVCRENANAIAGMAPPEFPLPDGLLAAETAVSGYTYYRHDPRKSAGDEVDPSWRDVAPSDTAMIFGGESLAPGSLFYHDVIVRGTVLEAGAVSLAIRRWAESGGHVGGMSARGHGRLRTWLHFSGPAGATAETLAAEYAAFLASTAEAARETLLRIYPSTRPAETDEPKPKKAKVKK